MSSRQPVPDIMGNILAANAAVFSQENIRGALAWVPVARVYDNPYQTRASYDDVAGLAESIRALADELPETLGLQQPPVARVVRMVGGDLVPVGRDAYADGAALRRQLQDSDYGVELHFGHRRLRAWKLLAAENGAYEEIPVLLAYADDLGMWRHVVAENSQRKDINAIEEAESLQLAINRFGLTQEEAGQPFGYTNRSTVANKLRLLNLPEPIRQQIAAGDITERHGRELMRLADAPARVAKLADLAIKKQLTVAQLSENVKWELEREAEDQEKARQLARAAALLADGYTPPGSSEPLPADRLRPDLDYYNVTALATDNIAPCSGACPCLVAVHARYASERVCRMDPDTPNIILGCTDHPRRKALQEATAQLAQAGDATAVAQLETQAAAQREAMRALESERSQKEARRAAIIAEADAIWQEALPQFDRSRLWNSIDFLRYAFKRGNTWWIENAVKEAADTGVLCSRMLEQLKESTRAYQDDVGVTVYDLEKLRAMVKQLIAFSTAGRKRQRAEVSQETAAAPATVAPDPDWERDWDDEDEASYQDLVAGWDMNWRHLPVATNGVLNAGITHRCLLRLVEYCPDAQVKADLEQFARALATSDKKGL